MRAQALYPVIEGILSTTAKSKLGNPQSMTPWLRGLKETVSFNARFIEDDHLLDVFPSLGSAEDTVQAAQTWVYGAMATSIHTVAEVVQFWNVATPTPGTTATGHQGTLKLAAAAATTPVIGGLLWYPFQQFTVTCLISSVAESDYATGAPANTVVGYVARRNQ